MNRLLIFILSVSVNFPAWAQQHAASYFQLSKLPEHDFISLDSGWKFHAGDNFSWAKPSINDSGWQPIKPEKRIDELPQVQDAGILWLRLTLHVPADMQGKTLSLGIDQIGASEIYFNGNLIEQYGTVSADFTKEITFNPFSRPLYIELAKEPVQVLAVRYSFNKRNVHTKWFSHVFLSKIGTTANAWQIGVYEYLKLLFLDFVNGGIFFILFILQLFLYIYNPGQKVNLYFMLYALGQCLINFFDALQYLIHSTTPSFFIDIFLNFAYPLANVFFLFSVYQLFHQSKGLWFKLVVACSLVPILSHNSTPDIQNDVWAISGGIIHLNVLRVSIIAMLKRSRGAKVFFAGQLIVVLFYTLLNLSGFFGIFGSLNSQVIITDNIFIYVVPAILISVILSSEVAQTNRSLKQQLSEVNRLSQKTLEQEKEKQQILSTQNETLEKQVTQRTSELQYSLENLKSTQAQLIQSEKMASLGELTAGIAHEIQNPLNFVNNFSEVNGELIRELVDEVDKGNTEEVKAIAKDIKENEEKINHHGKRADAIVKGMLQHSKQTQGIKEPTDINALCDEYLRLSYHGMRAKNKSFNADFKTEFDATIGKINIVPQDIGRVLLNLFNNAFYAVNEKQKHIDPEDFKNPRGLQAYKPLVSFQTKKLDDKVQIKVIDNGNGIPQNIVDKIFQPFFTTKPTGEGTGLGLSLAYDIIKAHGGEIRIETKEGEGAEFVIQISNT